MKLINHYPYDRNSAPLTSCMPNCVHDAITMLAPRHFTVLTGAGVSTDSGIPDYRGPGAPVRAPITYEEFVSGEANRQRFWARSYIGFSRMLRAEPNASHRALARLETAGRVTLLITQNVDCLHERAGSRSLCALHGRITGVRCLSCGHQSSRIALQERMRLLNPDLDYLKAPVSARPDGDAELEKADGFCVPSCEMCSGILKPDIVFFGENVPKDRVQCCYKAVEAGEALLVVGSSLTVLSGFQFVRYAHKLGIPIVIVNRGNTRGDDLATYKADMDCADFLNKLIRAVAHETSRHI